ncbi:MAG: hypothetical protein CME64_15185 [Halobacteriovoraceae bacterium]|nr:hypothetical protein [Halobacteriovoraceae bacterium]|tara:strand:- start:78471 stop:78893 length:423 start_codon:yes stop_codon:yes gene_type:complete
MQFNTKSGKASEGLLKETVELLPRYIDHIQSKSRELVPKLDESMDSIKEFGQLIDKVSSLIRLFSIVHSECKVYSQDNSSNEAVKAVEIHLLSILKAVKSAYLVQDTVLLADLLEYELQDNLTQWKICVIPMLKRMSHRS